MVYRKRFNKNKPYVGRNTIVKKTEAELPLLNENQLGENKTNIEHGFLNVGVFTALGALPVKDAVVTVYLTDEKGEEHALYHLVTDISGQVPTITLPVKYDPKDPLVSKDFYFSKYNLRVQAIGYYTQTILDLRVFPNITTNYKINLIPVMQGGSEDEPGHTIVIPPSPIDISN